MISTISKEKYDKGFGREKFSQMMFPKNSSPKLWKKYEKKISIIFLKKEFVMRHELLSVLRYGRREKKKTHKILKIFNYIIIIITQKSINIRYIVTNILLIFSLPISTYDFLNLIKRNNTGMIHKKVQTKNRANEYLYKFPATSSTAT